MPGNMRLANRAGRRNYYVARYIAARKRKVGAWDAHRRRGSDVFRYPAVRRGIYDGLIISAALAVLILLTTVVFPSGPDESDDDPEYRVQWFITVGLLAILLVAIGARGRRRQPELRLSAAVAGASAGVVLAAAITLIFLLVNNIWFGIVSQQHDKRVAFASSGWSSMRSYINVAQLRGGLFLLVALGLVGALLGLLGGAVFGGGAKTAHTPVDDDPPGQADRPATPS